MKQHTREYKGYTIYLTPQDKSMVNEDVWSWQGRVFDDMNDCIYSHKFTIDGVLWGNYTVDYMFQRVIFDLDILIEMEDV